MPISRQGRVYGKVVFVECISFGGQKLLRYLIRCTPKECEVDYVFPTLELIANDKHIVLAVRSRLLMRGGKPITYPGIRQ